MRHGPNSGALLTLAALVAAFFIWPRDAQAAQPAEDLPGDWPMPPAPDFGLDNEGYVMPDPDANLRAFLYMIRAAEHNPTQAANGVAYGMFYSGIPCFNFADHPVITGERVGVRLPDAMCRAAGFSAGCVSTAAGAYQIIKPTWQRVRRAGAWGSRLGDFSPASQDEAARRLLFEVGALPLIESGDIEGAIKRAAPVWASLPGNYAKQRQFTIDAALALFGDGLKLG